MDLKNYVNRPWDKVKENFDNYRIFTDKTYLTRHAEPSIAYTAYKDGKEFLIMVNKDSENVDAIKNVAENDSVVSPNIKKY